jgi:hypothetical protein
LPSQARRTSIGSQPGVDGVGDPPLEAAQGFFAGLPLGDLALVVGAAVAVSMRDLGDRGHVDGVVEPAVAARRQPAGLLLGREHMDRSSAVVGSEVVPGGEPGRGDDIADDRGGDHGTGFEHAGQGGAGGLDRGGRLLVHLAPLAVQMAHAGQQLGGELTARLAGRACGPDLGEDLFSPACGDFLGNPTGDQPAAPRAAGRRPGCKPGKDHDAASPAP